VQLQQVILNLLRNAREAMSSIEDRPRHRASNGAGRRACAPFSSRFWRWLYCRSC
jgi:signal transduction histidine kinase